ncbi:hypothetical protein ILUMI_11878 [Ignelater luminosus]|uniref:DDE Tnp4 domain-containing protein n=1 Tax=Ignelater luminosus TaxID=2038154 RepID=A0A8K0GCU6_IGNLU|nr:hypothetical protein ILUMI_11878 [Ignelater luminosus]
MTENVLCCALYIEKIPGPFQRDGKKLSCTRNSRHRTSSTIVKWPSDEEAKRIDYEFSQKQSIEEVIGAIDGLHVLIIRKGRNQNAYCNRKATHSIILHEVVDSRRFIDVFAGEPGSLHDTRVFNRSALYFKAVNFIIS